MAKDLPTGQDYIQWYATDIRPKLAKKLNRIHENQPDQSDFRSLFESLLSQQNHKCAISGEPLNLDQCYHEQSPWLRVNHQRTPWLPKYELVAWPFRSVRMQSVDLSDSSHQAPIIILDNDSDEDYY